jgi:hypothetical protein
MWPPRADEISPASGSSQWRLHRLVRAGLPSSLAETIAADRRYDLHAMLKLIDRGCPPELAARILAPLEDEGPSVSAPEGESAYGPQQ